MNKRIVEEFLLSKISAKIISAKNFFLENPPKQVFAWRLKELIRQTARRIKQKSGRCHSSIIAVDKDELKFTGHTVCTHGDPSGHTQSVKIRYKNKKTPESWEKVDVEVKCTCESFKYWGPERQSLVQNYNYPPLEGDGSLPTKNLKLKDGTPYTTVKLCKHLIAFGQELLKVPLHEWVLPTQNKEDEEEGVEIYDSNSPTTQDEIDIETHEEGDNATV